jgi:glycosyltransferase involved in cell wall biosynthesis
MSAYLLVAGDFVKTGGMDRANLALAHYLVRQGREVHVVAHWADEALVRAGAVVHHAPKPGGSYLAGEPFLDRIGRFWAGRIARRGGRVIVNGGNCLWGDVNWVHYLHAADAAATRASGSVRARVSRAMWRVSERRSLHCARIVVTNSRRTSRDVVDRCGIPSARVHTVYYGVDPRQFQPQSAEARSALRSDLGWPSTQPVVTFVGGLGDRRKGFDTLFTAWERLARDDGWNAMLAVVGAGRKLARWKQRAAALPAASTRFLGFRSDVPSILVASDVLIAPARYEAYGLGVHEALACGVPAFVSKSAGVAEWYPPELGDLLIDDPEDVDELMRKLQTWRRDVDGHRERVRGLSETLRKRSWDDMSAEFLRVATGGVADA